MVVGKTTYKIHFNGGRPFEVVICNEEEQTIVQVHKECNNGGYETIPAYTFNAKHVFVGASPKNEMTTFSGGHGRKFYGNTILAHLCEHQCTNANTPTHNANTTNHNTYAFIGKDVFTFASISPIVQYVSPVGNNDVPYPYAVDEHNNIYLLIEDVILLSAPDRTVTPEFDPYRYYYDHALITTNKGWVPPQPPKIKNFRNIKNYYHGHDQFTMRYHPNPDVEYDELTSRLGSMFIVDTLKQKRAVTKDEYAHIMTEFGQLNGFKPIENITKL